MNRHIVRTLIVYLGTSLITFAADKTAPAALEATLDKAMKAYNAGDWKAFFADYAPSMSAIATEQTFKALSVQSRGEFEILTKRPLVPSENERDRNPRSRSAKLRVMQRVVKEECV